MKMRGCAPKHLLFREIAVSYSNFSKTEKTEIVIKQLLIVNKTKSERSGSSFFRWKNNCSKSLTCHFPILFRRFRITSYGWQAQTQTMQKHLPRMKSNWRLCGLLFS